MRLKSFVVIVWMLAFSNSSLGESCLYGLYAQTAEICCAAEAVALVRVASAKTICFSGNSRVEWSKNDKQPVGAFTSMRNGARVAMKGFTPLYACERADLVIKIVYESTSDSVTFSVTDAESGDVVFKEDRAVSDLGSDLTRMGMHFQNMRSAAIADQASNVAKSEAKAKRETFFANLPKHWRYAQKCDDEAPCPEVPTAEVWVSEGVLHESSSYTLADAIKREISCDVVEGADEVTPWTGHCIYTLSWPNWSRPTCNSAD